MKQNSLYWRWRAIAAFGQPHVVRAITVANSSSPGTTLQQLAKIDRSGNAANAGTGDTAVQVFIVAAGRERADWPVTRPATIWNSVPGFTRIRKITNRKSAVAGIWKAFSPAAY
jgi:hypothetical protein